MPISRLLAALCALVKSFRFLRKFSTAEPEPIHIEKDVIDTATENLDNTDDQVQNEEFHPPDSNHSPAVVDESLITDPKTTDEGNNCSPNTDDDRQRESESDVNHSIDTNSRKAKKSPGYPRAIKGRRNRKSTKQSHRARPPVTHKPELACRKVNTSPTWEVILLAEEECQLASVHLNGESLEITPSICIVPYLEGCLNVICNNGEELNIPLFNDAPLIFKLRKNWEGRGRRIIGLTSGHFIVIAPNSWQRTIGAPVESDECTDEKFKAHYFYRSDAESNELNDGFFEWPSFSQSTKVELTGQHVYDDSDDGMLFVGDAPTLESSPKIAHARVGEENGLGWGQNFVPTEESLSDILSGREGHFFLRIYDQEVKLLDSVGFRFHSNLKKINVNDAEYAPDTVLLPSPTGYQKTKISLLSTGEPPIQTELRGKSKLTQALSDVIEVPPLANSDNVSFSLRSDSRDVRIVLDLPRIWWRLENEQFDGSNDWLDVPLSMTREEFRKHANSNTHLSLLSKRVRSVRAGFDGELDQSYSRTIEESCIVIPLANFVDYEQIDHTLNTNSQFNVEWANQIVSLIVISADPMPEIVSFSAEPTRIFAGQEVTLSWTTRNTDNPTISITPDIGAVEADGTLLVYPNKTIQYALALADPNENEIGKKVAVTVVTPRSSVAEQTAQVLSSGGGWRNGRGFSIGELRQAGLMSHEVADSFISIDRRRRTVHPINIEVIKTILND